MTFAPIAFFAFRRLDVLRESIAALERCEGFDPARVHVFSDGPREQIEEEAGRVGEVRDWLEGWCSANGARLHLANGNMGLRPSITSGVSDLVEEFDRVIVLEDDIQVSPTFLSFMDQALDFYANDSRVFQVSGYNVPHSKKLPRAGFIGVPACWGWGTWKRAWQYYRDDASGLLAEIRVRDTVEFDIAGTYGYLDSLERNAAGTLNTWLVRWYASIFLQGGLVLYPGKSLTRNAGFGEEGTNCGPGTMAHVFANQALDTKPLKTDLSRIPVHISTEFTAALSEFYRWQNEQWTKPTLRQRINARIGLMLGHNEQR